MNFIFDLYGTLIDIKTDESGRAFWQTVAAELGVGRLWWRSVRREYLTLCKEKSLSSDHEFELLDVFCDMLRAHGKDAGGAQTLARVFRRASMKKLRVFPHVAEMLCDLRAAGAGVYLLSNAQACFTRDELDACGLTSLFDGIVISSDVGVKKPSSKIFEIALEKFGVSADDCIYVGNDMRDDVMGASGAGIRTVYIRTEQSREYPSLELPSPTYVAADHSSLADLLISLA